MRIIIYSHIPYIYQHSEHASFPQCRDSQKGLKDDLAYRLTSDEWFWLVVQDADSELFISGPARVRELAYHLHTEGAFLSMRVNIEIESGKPIIKVSQRVTIDCGAEINGRKRIKISE